MGIALSPASDIVQYASIKIQSEYSFITLTGSCHLCNKIAKMQKVQKSVGDYAVK
jgi:hypothetical protein